MKAFRLGCGLILFGVVGVPSLTRNYRDHSHGHRG